MTAQRLLVTGLSGGLGTTVLAATLAARAAHRGMRTAVVERQRGGLDAVCGVDGWPGTRLDDLVDLDGRLDGRRLVAAVPQPGSCAVLAHACDVLGPRLSDEQHAAVVDALADAVDLLVVDLGRRPGPPGPSTAEGVTGTDDPLGAVDDLVLVVGSAAHQLGVAAGAITHLLDDLPASVRSHLVVTGTGLDPDAVADGLGLPSAVALRPDPAVDRALAAAALPGRSGRGPLPRAADALLDAAGVRAARPRAGRRGRFLHPEADHVAC